MSGAGAGVVVSRHPHATDVGIDVLAAGGNAFDAAVAVGFAISVLDAGMCGLGGGFFMLVYRTADGREGVIEGPVVAPALTPEGAFELDPDGPRGIYGFPAVRDRANVVGHRSVAVPGAVAGLCATRDQLGTLPLARLVEPAAAIAEDGFELSWADVGQWTMGRDLLERHPATALTFLPWGAIPAPAFQFPSDPAPRFRQPDLARTLRRIGDEGADAFYRGSIADAIDEEMQRGGGWLRKSDLADYRIERGQGTTGRYRDWSLLTGPDWVVLEVLGILERFDLTGLAPDDPRRLHLVAEACFTGHADLYRHLARPASAPDASARYLEPVWLDARAAEISPERVVRRAFANEDRPAGAAGPGGRHTTGFACSDAAGNVAAVLLTLGDPWGSGITVPGTGILLNDQMFGFNAAPGTATSVGPGARRPVPGWPVIATGPDGALLALATPGGNRVLCANVQVIANRIDHDLPAPSAVAAPRIDRGSVPLHRELLLADEQLPRGTVEGLRALGHEVAVASRSLHWPGAAPGTFAYPVALGLEADGRGSGRTDPPIPGAARTTGPHDAEET